MTVIGFGLDGQGQMLADQLSFEHKERNKVYIWGIVLGVGLCVGMLIARLFVDDMDDMPVYAAVAAGGMMLLITWAFGLRDYRHVKRSFEGQVYKTKTKKKTVRREHNKDRFDVYYTYYIYVKKTSGGRIRFRLVESGIDRKSVKGERLLMYYNNAYVKKYPAIPYPEKYDKSHDTYGMCLMCGRENEVDANFCKQCGSLIP